MRAQLRASDVVRELVAQTIREAFSIDEIHDEKIRENTENVESVDPRFGSRYCFWYSLMSSIPQHVAIIMDGNRRWAKAQGLPTLEGHRRGYENVKQVADWCIQRGVKVMTIFAFSTENWKRTEEEVGYLMNLVETMFRSDVKTLHERGIRLRVLGQRDRLRPSILEALDEAQRMTEQNTKLTLAVCFNYGGRQEIVDACKKIVQAGIPAEQIDEKTIASHLYWPDIPEPDLIIRTSGEERISGFLLWECAYSEFYWTQTHWPAFSEGDFEKALEEYAARQRRYGA